MGDRSRISNDGNRVFNSDRNCAERDGRPSHGSEATSALALSNSSLLPITPCSGPLGTYTAGAGSRICIEANCTASASTPNTASAPVSFFTSSASSGESVLP